MESENTGPPVAARIVTAGTPQQRPDKAPTVRIVQVQNALLMSDSHLGRSLVHSHFFLSYGRHGLKHLRARLPAPRGYERPGIAYKLAHAYIGKTQDPGVQHDGKTCLRHGTQQRRFNPNLRSQP